MSVCHLQHKGRDTNRSILESHGEERSGEVADSWAVFQTEAVIWPQPAFVTLGFMASPPSSFLISLNIFCVLQTQLAPPFLPLFTSVVFYAFPLISVSQCCPFGPSMTSLFVIQHSLMCLSMILCSLFWLYIHTYMEISILTCLVLLLLFLPCIQFSCSVVSDSLWDHGLQHTRLPCPSPTPGAYSNSCPLSPWCHPTVSFSVVPFSSCLRSFPASGFFSTSQFFASGGQSIEVLASASVLPMNELISFRIDWVDLLAVQVTLKSFL